MSEKIDLFDSVSPLDYRYYGRDKALLKELGRFFSENARIHYQLRVQEALVKVLAKKGICSRKIAAQVSRAVKKVNAEDVYKEEDKIRHDVRSLVNSIRKHVSKEARPFVHLGLTSNDVIDTANSLRFKEAAEKVILPELKELEKTLIKIALREKKTLQIGRTHGQHAEPITFGFYLSWHINRLGEQIEQLERAKNNLHGKIAGAVGAYNASSLVFKNPEEIERLILKELGLEPEIVSTQLLRPEPLLDLVHSSVAAFGILANIADDMRNLQRSEIAEVFEEFGAKQVGSSTMPQKRNPINFENVKSFWKAFMPRITTLYLDQVSEHQRDLTNSASSRFVPEIMVGLILSSRRLNKSMSRLRVDKENMRRNFEKSADFIAAEPLYVLLALHGHPDAHEYVRKLTLEAQKTGKSLQEIIALHHSALHKYFIKFSKKQLELIKDPSKYTGLSEKKTIQVCKKWKKRLKI